MVTINLQANIPLFLKSFRFGDFLLAFLMLVSTSANGITIAGQYIPAWRAGVSGGIPDIPTVGSVTDFGAIPNDKRDDTLAFIKAIKKLEGQGAILIPEGTFLLTAPIAMPSGTVLRGQGSDKTHIEINHSGHGFVVKGKGTGSGELENPMEYPKVVRGAFKGSYEIELDKAGKFSLGDGIELVQGYDKSLHATQPKWDQSWAKRLIGHFSRIESLTNNTIKLSDKIRIDMNYSKDIRAVPVEYVSDIGFEDFSVIRKDKSDTYIFYIQYGSNVWANGIHSQYAAKGHYYVAMSRRFELRDSFIEFAHSYGSGGHGYGVELTHRTTGALIINNIFNHLRHSMMLHIGANGNVLMNNFSTDSYQDDGSNWVPPDVSFHGHYAYSNLVEGNLVSEIGIGDYWGPTGPDNVIFRNQIVGEGLRGYDHSVGQFAIANQFAGDEDIVFDRSIEPGSWVLLDNKRDGIDLFKNTEEITVLDLPESYYFSAPPAYLAGYYWPPIGSGSDSDSIPALDRFIKIRTSSQTPGTTPDFWVENALINKEIPNQVNQAKSSAALKCTILQDNNWNTGNLVRIYLTNTSDTRVSGWSINVHFKDGSRIEKVWSAKWSPDKEPEKIVNKDWNEVLEPGETKHFGIKIRKATPDSKPVIPEISSDLCH